MSAVSDINGTFVEQQGLIIGGKEKAVELLKVFLATCQRSLQELELGRFSNIPLTKEFGKSKN